MIDRAKRTLRDVFGLDAFRPGQSDVVAAMLAGRDVLSVAPTGSGKSISYWVPALVDGGMTTVVSPLIALMKDQVDRLVARGVAATFINSSVERSEQGDRRGIPAAVPGARATWASRVHGAACGAPGPPCSRRRGALHLHVGTRLPA